MMKFPSVSVAVEAPPSICIVTPGTGKYRSSTTVPLIVWENNGEFIQNIVKIAIIVRIFRKMVEIILEDKLIYYIDLTMSIQMKNLFTS